jgi:Bacteriophage probable baseplate hub protein
MATPDVPKVEEQLTQFYPPAHRILVSKQNLVVDLGLEVASVQVDNTLEGADQFTFVINNGFDIALRDFPHLRIFELGAPVQIHMGYGDLQKLELLLNGLVTSVNTSFPSSGPLQITVSGYDLSYPLTKGKRSHNWENAKDSDVVRQIAGRHNLQPEVKDSEVVHPKIEQSQESDFQFVRKLAERNGFEFFVFDKTLHFSPPANGESGTIKLEWGQGLVSFSPEVTLAEQVTEVEIRGWNVRTKQEIIGRARAGDEPGRDPKRLSGAEYLRKICKEKAVLRIRQPVYDQQEADRRARSVLKLRSEKFIKGSGESIGIPALRAGRNVELAKVGEFFSKTYYVEQTTHKVDSSGYKTTFRVKEATI